MASRSLNRVILIGNLTRDPELKYTPTGTPVCSFGVATNRSWTTADGQQKEDVQYHRIVAWQKLAELCAKLLTKGKKIYLEGRITYRTFTGKDGQERFVTEIVMDDFIVFNGSNNRKADVDSEEMSNQPVKKQADQEEVLEEKQAKKDEEEETKNEKSTDEKVVEEQTESDQQEEVQIDESDMPF